MDCKQCEALLNQYLEETLGMQERQAMEEHLLHCEACRFRLRVLEDCRTLNEDDEVPISFSQGWRQQITKEEVHIKKMINPKLTRWMAVAAALLVLVGGTWLTGQDRRQLSAVDTVIPYATEDRAMGSGLVSYAVPPAPDSSYAAKMDTAEPTSDETGKIIRTVSLEMSTRLFDTDYAAILQALGQAGGRVQNTNLYVSTGNLRTAYIILRVPSDKLDALTSSVKSFGRLVSFNESADDVSEQYADTDSRLKTQQTKMERLQVLLAKAETVEDLITIETSISDTQYEIDHLTGQLRGMDSKVSFSTVNVTLSEASAKETAETKEASLFERIKNGMIAAFQGFTYLLSDLLVFLSIILPYLVVIVILVLIIRYIIKRRKNK